mmetsp:Transcript_7564/g.11337  ORF Transcript_7564/g.11337 Transcript_7564/m.11337 type:complete len:95 (-) Transcript_7564:2495-2779(-)
MKEETSIPSALPTPAPTSLPFIIEEEYVEEVNFQSQSPTRPAGFAIVAIMAIGSIVSLILLITLALVSHFRRRKRRLTESELRDSKLESIPMAF